MKKELETPETETMECGPDLILIKPEEVKREGPIIMSEEEKKMLDDLFIQSIRRGSKRSFTHILCSGIKLLHEKEFSKDPSDKI